MTTKQFLCAVILLFILLPGCGLFGSNNDSSSTGDGGGGDGGETSMIVRDGIQTYRV